VTLATALTGGTEAGDIFFDDTNLIVTPPSAVTLTVQATRDIVVNNTIIRVESGGAPLNIDFQAAGNDAFGVISIDGSSFTTGGGNVTLGGTVDRLLPTPGGGVTLTTFRPARAYSTATGGFSSALGGGQDAVRLDGSVFELGGGTFRAVGEGAVDARDGVAISSDTGGLMRISAGQVQIIGHSPAPTAVDLDRIGVIIGGQNTEIVATESIFIQGAGDQGGAIESGARLSLAGSGTGTFVFNGFGGVREGAALYGWDVDTDTAGRGTRLTVGGGTLVIEGVSTFGATGVRLDNTLGAPGPLIDLSAAGTGVSSIGGSGTGSNVQLDGVDLVLGGSLLISSSGLLDAELAFISGSGNLSLVGAGITLSATTVLAESGPLNLAFSTDTVFTPEGVRLVNTIVETGGGNVTFGDLRIVGSSGLGFTTVPANWVEYDGSASRNALEIADTVIDAGSGRIVGGGAAGSTAFDAGGLDIFRSTLIAANIELAGRSDFLEGVLVEEGTLIATATLSLDGASASNFPPAAYGVRVLPRSLLQLVDLSAAASSAMTITGTQLTDGIGVLLEGGAVGSGLETRLVVEGADLSVIGRSQNGIGVALRGNAAASGGLLVSAAGARSALFDGRVTLDESTGGSGTGLELLHARVTGPQLAADAPLDFIGNGDGGGTGLAGLRVDFSNISSGGVTTFAGNDIRIAESLLAGDGDIRFFTQDALGASGSLGITFSQVQVENPGAQIVASRRDGSAAVGRADLFNGAGVYVQESLLRATGAGGRVELRGQGADIGGAGVLVDRTPISAFDITLFGRGVFNADGVSVDDFSGSGPTASLSFTSLDIDGVGANDPVASTPDRVGVRLGLGSELLPADGGSVLIQGDTAVLGSPSLAGSYLVTGAPASFEIRTTGAMNLPLVTLGFSSAATVNLIADTDSDGQGRVRLVGTVIQSSGGDITISGAGVTRGTGTPSQNIAVQEGSAGVLLDSSVLDAFTGAVTLQGTAPTDGLSGPFGGQAGVLVSGTSFITAGSLLVQGDGGERGHGIDVGSVVPGSTLALDVGTATFTGRGADLDPGTGFTNAGVRLQAPGGWTVATSLALEATDSAVDVGNAALAAPTVRLEASGTAAYVKLVSSTVQANAGDLLLLADGGVQATGTTLAALGAGSTLVMGAAGDTFTVGTDGVAGGAGILLVDSTVAAPDAGTSIFLRGAGAAGGGNGVEFVRSSIAAESVTLAGRGSTEGHGVISNDTSDVVSTLAATNLTVDGIGAVDPGASDYLYVGVWLGNAVELSLLGTGGAVQIVGDTVLLGSPVSETPLAPFSATGAPASLTVLATRSVLVREATLDFSSGGGTSVLIEADSDGIDGGRARLDNASLVRSAGGDIDIRGVGVPGLTLAGDPIATYSILSEGASGVLLANTVLDAGTGSVFITGSGVVNPDILTTTLGGTWGVLSTGAPSISGQRIEIFGNGGTRGVGVDVGFGTPGATLTLNATDILVRGVGADFDPGTGAPYEGVLVDSASTWTAGNSLSVEGSGIGGLSLTGLALSSGGPMNLGVAGPTVLVGVTATAGGSLDVAGGSGDVRPGISVRDGTSLSGATVTVTGLNAGGGLGVELLDDFGSPAITATAGPLTLSAGTTPGTGRVSMVGAWSLSTPGLLTIESPELLALDAGAGTSGVGPIFNAGDVLIDIASAGEVVVGGAAAAGFLSSALSALAPDSTTTLRLSSGASMAVRGVISSPGRLRVQADVIGIESTGGFSSAAAGDAIVLAAADGGPMSAFDNAAGATALDASTGRWVILATSPATTTLGGLVPAFSAYGLAGTPWVPDGSGDLITPAPGDALGYSVTPFDVTGAVLTGSVTRDYDTTANVTLDPGTWSITGLVPGDTLLLSGVDVATLADKAVGTDRPLTLDAGSVFTVVDAGGAPVFGYEDPTFTATITPLALTASGTAVAPKVYDTTTTATLASLGTVTPLSGDTVVLGGTIVANFDDKNVGSAKPVLASGFVLTGADAGNYTLVAPSGLSGDITPAPLAVTGVTAVDKVYDATSTAVLAGTAAIVPLGTDVVVLGGTALADFDDKNVGTAKPVTVLGYTISGADAVNYTLVQPTGLAADITPATLVVGGLTAIDRVYDRTTVAPLAGSPTITPLGSDAVSLAGTATGTFATATVGTAKPVAVGGLTLTGTDAGNYLLVAPASLAADVTPLALAVTGTVVADKVYDATTTATLSSPGTVTPLAGDTVGLGGTIVASFGDKNVGTAKPVTASGFALTGADAGNYTLVAPTGLTADITPALLVVAGVTAVDKVYDAGTAATLAGTAGITPLGTDVVVLGGTALASFADKNVGTARPVTVSGYAITGTDAANYSLVQPTGLAADITAAPLLVGGLTALDRVYDRTTVAPLAGTPTVAPLGSDVVSLAGTATGTFATATVGTAKPVAVGGLTLSGADAGNYLLVLPAALAADVTPASLTLADVAATSRVYAGTAVTATTASGTLAGVIAGDTVTVTLSASFADGNAALGKPVSVSGVLAGADAANYLLAGSFSTTADITPAPLLFSATPVLATLGSPVPALTGSLSGFVGGDTPATAITGGALVWTSPGTVATVAGSYAITGGGIVTPNYVHVQDAANATAYTLRAATVTDPVSTATTVITASSLVAVSLPVTMSTPTEGRTLDVTPAFAGSLAAVAPSLAGALTAAGNEIAGGLAYPPLDFSRLPRDEIQSLLAARARYKQQVFSRGIFALQQDPTLADVRGCRTEAEIETGLCLITEQLKAQIQAARDAAAEALRQAEAVRPGFAPAVRPGRRVVQAALPVIERKLALLIGVNDYADKVVPQLLSPIPDARAVRDRLEQRLGYETTVLENPTREQIVRAFNRLAVEARPEDSVVVYFGGHGVVVPVDGVDTGFWLPADIDSRQPGTWLANGDIARLIAAIGSRQVMLVSDSCYSGRLVGRESVDVGGAAAGDLLSRRAAIVLSSGGDEPVSDEGKDGHSVFAWHFMRALEGLDGWQPGNSLFERLRTAVNREFPQTPQYGGSRGLGHEGNTDYLFERREIEAAVPAVGRLPMPAVGGLPAPANPPAPARTAAVAP
jgi:hypothetical protein